MQLEFATPPAVIAPYVALFFRFREPAAHGEAVERADVGQMRFMLTGAGRMIYPGNRVEAATPITVIGPGTAAARCGVSGPFDCFGFSMRPVGWAALVGVPADEHADRLSDGAVLFGEAAATLVARLRDAPTLDDMIAVALPFLIERAAEHPIPADHHRLIEAVRIWLVQDGPVDVADLFAALPWSSRQVTRLVNRYFGGPPKFLERKFRALRAASAIAAGADPAIVAAGYYDQPYMINEIRHFTGQTPGDLNTRMDPLLSQTLAASSFNELAPVEHCPRGKPPG